MNRRKYVSTFVALMGLTIGASLTLAHNGVEHVMGTVKTVTDTSITVETVKHTSVTVNVDGSTTYADKEAKATLKDLKPGERVVINAKEGSDKKLQAISVKWSGSSVATGSHADHK